MLLFTETISETKELVRCIHYKPEMLTEAKRLEGIVIDTIPEPEERRYEIPVLYYNPVDQTLFYEYELIEKE